MKLRNFRPLDDDPKKYGITFEHAFRDNDPVPPAVFEIDPAESKRPGNATLCALLDKMLKGKATLKPGKPGGMMANIVDTEGEENTEGHEVQTKKQIIQAKHREKKLVKDFKRILQKKGREITRLRYSKAGKQPLFCDLYEEKKRHLLEAKASCSREDVRMAVGQLLDYAQLTKAAKLGQSKLAILVPERPQMRSLIFLESIPIDIGLVWRRRYGFQG